MLRHPGLVPGSTLRRGAAARGGYDFPADGWTPEHVRGDEVDEAGRMTRLGWIILAVVVLLGAAFAAMTSFGTASRSGRT